MFREAVTSATSTGTSSKGSIKLRAACNYCNLTKVKCSGQRTGCNQCETHDIECVYVESRVGKVQGSRSKKKKRSESENSQQAPLQPQPHAQRQRQRQQHQQHQQRRQSVTTSTSEISRPISPEPERPIPPSSPRAASTLLESTSPDMFDNDIMNWSLEQPLHNDITSFSVSYPTIYNDGAREEDGVEEMEREPSFNAPPNPAVPRNNGRYPAFLSSTSSEPLGTAFDFGVDEPLQTFTPSSSGCDSCLTSPRMLKPHRCHLPLQSPAYTYPKSTALDSQCVRACTQIISGLENYLAADLRVLDLVLEVVKRAVEKLEQLIVLQQDSRCSRCMTLFATILHQIIELLETGCAAFLAERDHCNPAASAGFEKPNFLVSGSVFSGDLGFRAFAIDAEDQFQWKNRTVQKELRQAMKILQNFNDLSKIDGPQNVWNVHSSGCSPSELTLRFQSLYERVSGGGKFKEI